MGEPRYARQSALRAFTYAELAAVRRATVVCIGAGGVASAFLEFIVGAGCGNLIICDYDTVDLVNLHRQVIHSESAAVYSQNKAESARERLRQLNSDVTIYVIGEMVTPSNVGSIIGRYHPDVVVDTTDNPEARFCVAHYCRDAVVPHVYAAAVKLDFSIASFNLVRNQACFGCIFSRMPACQLRMTAATQGVLGPVVGVVGSLAAIEVIKILCHRNDEEKLRYRCLCNKMVFGSLLEGFYVRELNFSRRKECYFCKMSE